MIISQSLDAGSPSPGADTQAGTAGREPQPAFQPQ